MPMERLWKIPMFISGFSLVNLAFWGFRPKSSKKIAFIKKNAVLRGPDGWIWALRFILV